jgi:MFS family permease
MTGTFRSLAGYNYRLWAGGALVSNVGTWMQRTAQGWLVLTQLTDNNATAVGIVMALQFGPHFPLLPFTGYVADHYDRRKVLLCTQAAQGMLAFGLGLLTIAGLVQLWHVYAFALLLGCVSAFDAPARQTFVSELVGEADLSNAVALNSTSFNGARLIGPAAAGMLIGVVGTGWVFIANALSYAAVLASLAFLRLDALHRRPRAVRAPGGFVEGFRYVWRRPDLKAVLLMLFLVSTFGLNFQIFIPAMAVSAFHVGAREFGFLMSTMAIGSVAGALGSARRAGPRLAVLLAGAGAFGVACLVAALMPNPWSFGLVLVATGIAAQTFSTTANTTVQLATDSAMRGRVMAIYLAISLGGTPIGAPIVGWVADAFGPRWSLGVGAASGFAALLVGVRYLVKYRGLRVHRGGGKWRVDLDAVDAK